MQISGNTKDHSSLYVYITLQTTVMDHWVPWMSGLDA